MSVSGEKTKKTKRGRTFSVPHVYVILFVFSGIGAVLTHFLPAGRYERVPGPDGRTVIDPDSFEYVQSTPVGLVDFMTAIPRGLIDASEVVFFTFIIGGAFMVLRESGIIESGVNRLSQAFANRGALIIPVLMTVFAAIATIIGTQELSLVYVPVILPLMIALGFDSIVAVAIALCGTTIGFTAGILNPINTGLGQAIADLEPFSGKGLRIALFVALLIAGSYYVTRYARRVKQNPEHSLIHAEPDEEEKRKLYAAGHNSSVAKLNTRQTFAAWLILPFAVILVWGVTTQGWFFIEISGLLVAMGIVVGLVAGLNTSELAEGFNRGLRDVLVGAIIVGVARSVAVVLEDGQVMDTIVLGLGALVSSLPPVISAVGMYIAQSLFNFIVPSGSGQALVTMPIMGPLSDVVGVTRQTAVLAYQLGDGLTNIIFPTSGYFMAVLAIGKVRWEKWSRFFLPLLGIWVAIAIAFLIYAQATSWNG